MKSIMVRRGPFAEDVIMLVDIDLSIEVEKSKNEVIDIMDNSNGQMRVLLHIDTHNSFSEKELLVFLNGIDYIARKKGIDIRLKFSCLCDTCKDKTEEIRDSTEWMSRWDV